MMKQTVLIAALALVVSSPVLAQEGGKKGPGGERRQGAGRPGQGGPQGGARRNPLSRMVNELDLTPDQKVKADKIMDEMSKKLAEINKDAREKLEVILTDEQKKKMREMLLRSRQRGPGGPGGQGGPGGPGAGRPARP